jgi:thymidylate kinase
MGDIKSVNPLLFASLYAQNRFDVTPLLRFWIRRGDNVILDRYVEANFGHQASAAHAGPAPARRWRGIKFFISRLVSSHSRTPLLSPSRRPAFTLALG